MLCNAKYRHGFRLGGGTAESDQDLDGPIGLLPQVPGPDHPVDRNHRTRRVGNDSAEGVMRDRFALIRGLGAHALLVGGLVAAGFWASAVAWVLAVGVVFPYLSALRQQL